MEAMASGSFVATVKVRRVALGTEGLLCVTVSRYGGGSRRFFRCRVGTGSFTGLVSVRPSGMCERTSGVASRLVGDFVHLRGPRGGRGGGDCLGLRLFSVYRCRGNLLCFRVDGGVANCFLGLGGSFAGPLLGSFLGVGSGCDVRV